MPQIAGLLATLLWLYMLVLIGRLIFEWVQVFARNWKPSGVLLVIAEAIYTVTDPPLRVIRKFLPPIRIGQVALDLSFLVLIVLLGVVVSVLSAFAAA
ncbi:MAG: YggT family protein [Candidatus Nanopelagicales bacterium]|nr:YggT family protein [Candidatus Nanopelagicales bacterium]MDZ4248511.1 YggT family protein [Candidatus Nanopelagicales bacterium]MDZ7577887.1 YggT family protein [Candidatus Nanopelagicales bacterium]